MKIDQLFLHPQAEIRWASREIEDGSQADILLTFADQTLSETKKWMGKLRQLYPQAIILSCTMAGDWLGTAISENRIVVTVIQLEGTRVKLFLRNNRGMLHSYQTSRSLAELIPTNGLQQVFLISDRQQVNGKAFIKAFNALMPPGISVSGGLAGDATRFDQMWVSFHEEGAVAIAFYDGALQVGQSSIGRWGLALSNQISISKDTSGRAWQFGWLESLPNRTKNNPF